MCDRTASSARMRRRVTALGLSVCLSVCLSVDAYSGTTGYEAAYELQGPEKLRGDSLETTAFGRYGMKTSEKANMIMSTRLPRCYCSDL